MKKLFLYIFILLLYSCEDDKITIEEIIQLEILPTKTGFADGRSAFILKAIIPEAAAENKRSVTFKTTSGTFRTTEAKQEITIQADIDSDDPTILSAEAVLIAPGSVSIATVNARILDWEANDTIVFNRAMPSRITMIHDVPAISSNFSTDLPTEAFLEGTIQSETGIASSGTAVNFLVYDNETGGLLTEARFRNKQNIGNSQGKVTGYLSIGNITPAPKTLRVEFEIDKNKEIRDTAYIEVF